MEEADISLPPFTLDANCSAVTLNVEESLQEEGARHHYSNTSDGLHFWRHKSAVHRDVGEQCTNPEY